MKRIFLALIMVMFAASVHAQDTGEPCADPVHEEIRTRLYEKTCTQIAAEEAIAQQDRAGIDLVGGAKRAILSGNRADILYGLQTLQNYLKRTETVFFNSDIQACTSASSAVRWNRPACNPIPHLQTLIEREFNRLGWPVAETPSGAYAWLIEQYQHGPADIQPKVRNFADINATEIMSQNLLARAEQSRTAQLAATQQQARQEVRAEQAAYRSSFTGNIATMGDRLGDAVMGWLGSGVTLFVLLVILARLPLPLTLEQRGRMSRVLGMIWLTMLPFYALYVPFGGWFDGFSRSIPSWLRWLLLIGVFVPAYVAMSRLLSQVQFRLPSFVRPTATSAPAAGGLHGSAHWSDSASAIQRGRYQPAGNVLADSHGFTLGRAPDHASKAMQGFDSRLRYMGHVLTVAPNGSGKGIGAVVPALLDYPGSTIVLDVKGENYAVTSRFRREQLGHDVYLLDPFGVIQQQQAGEVKTHAFNWLDRLDPDSPDVVGESATLADMIVVSEGHASDSSAHFNETAKSLIRGVLVHVSTLPAEKRNMAEVRRILTLPVTRSSASTPSPLEIELAKMMANPRGFGVPGKAATAFTDTPEKERGSVLSTVRRHLAFLDDPRLLDAVSRSDFSLDDLKRRKMTVYLVMPPARLNTARSFVRAFFGQAINAVMAGAGKPDYRVLFLLDEFPQLGRMDIVEEKLPLIRGYGGAFWLVAQNLAQLKETYPRWQNFIANCGGKQFFGTSDIETARYVSDSLGKMTVEFHTKGANTNTGASVSAGSSNSQQFTGRELLTADEIMRLPREQEIVLVTGEAPYLLNRLNYLRDPEYAGRFDQNPYE